MPEQITREAAKVLLNMIEADSKIKIEQAGATSWSRIGYDEDGVVLLLKIHVPKGTQTQLTEFEEPED